MEAKRKRNSEIVIKCDQAELNKLLAALAVYSSKLYDDKKKETNEDQLRALDRMQKKNWEMYDVLKDAELPFHVAEKFRKLRLIVNR